MMALTFCSRVNLILVILMTSPLLTSAVQLTRDCREDPTQEQIEAGIKLFDYTAHYTDEHADAAFKRVEDCLRDCPRKQRSLVIKEILLRLQFRELGEDCTSIDEKYKYILYNGDYKSADSTPYQAWQNELLETGLIFCTPFKHLYCSPISKKCECRPGTILRRHGTCEALVGGFCWIPGVASPERGKFPRLFDAYNNREFHRDYSVISEPRCTGECAPGLKFFMDNMCADKELTELDDSLDFYFNDVLRRVNFGDSCNLEHETQLFTTTEAEIRNYTIRVQNLNALRIAAAKFCRNGRLLVCGSEGKCECMKPAIYNNETKLCTFRSPHESCQEESRFKKIALTFPGMVRKEMLNGFEVARKRECPFGCYPNSKFCFTCPDSFGRVLLIGKNCEKRLTYFLFGAPPPSLPIDIPDYDKQVELFVQFNEKAKEFEGLFRLVANTSCDYDSELEAHRLIRRIKSVEVPGIIYTEQDYKDIMSSIDKHIIGKRIYCSGPFLLCGPTQVKPICNEITNSKVYLEIWSKRWSREFFQATSTNGFCVPHPSDFIKYAEFKFPRSLPLNGEPTELSTGAFAYLFDTLESHWIQKAQYCNRTGGFICTKSVDDKTNATGKCEFSKDLLDEVLAEAEAERLSKIVSSKSSHHSIHSSSFLTPLYILHIIILN